MKTLIQAVAAIVTKEHVGTYCVPCQLPTPVNCKSCPIFVQLIRME